MAQGQIVPAASIQPVQHLEGGIIQEILARDGDEVEAGDPLMILSEVQAQASHKVLVAERLRLSAQLARLRSEQAGLDAPNFPAWLAAEAENNPEAAEVVAGPAARTSHPTRAGGQAPPPYTPIPPSPYTPR